jgi:hypothetical protein
MLKISQYTKIFFEYILDTNIGYTKVRTKNINRVSDRDKKNILKNIGSCTR